MVKNMFFHEHIPNGRKIQSLRIGPPRGQTLNPASGGILHSLTPQNIDSGINTPKKSKKS